MTWAAQRFWQINKGAKPYYFTREHTNAHGKIYLGNRYKCNLSVFFARAVYRLPKVTHGSFRFLYYHTQKST